MPGAGIIDATNEAYYPLTRILAVVSHFEPSNGCQVQQFSDNLGLILSLCYHFRASEHYREANNDYEARKL